MAAAPSYYAPTSAYDFSSPPPHALATAPPPPSNRQRRSGCPSRPIGEAQLGRGRFVTDLAAVTSITLKATSCKSFTTDQVDALEATATGGTKLTYDPRDNRVHPEADE
jgi:hypothetical protein